MAVLIKGILVVPALALQGVLNRKAESPVTNSWRAWIIQATISP